MVSIGEYFGQEPEMDRALADGGATKMDRAKGATSFYLGLKLELSVSDITEKIDFQKKLTADEVKQMAGIARKYREIANAEVRNADNKLVDALTDTATQADGQNIPADGAKLLREFLHDLKYRIVVKWADAKVH